MQTLFQAPERNYNDYQADETVNFDDLTTNDVKAIFDIVSILSVGAFCDITIEISKDSNVLCRTVQRFDEVGQFVAGMSYGDNSGQQCRIIANMNGRMRARFRVASFAQGEEIPEVIL